MIAKELTDYLSDKVILYIQKNNSDEYIDFLKDIRKCSQELLQMEVNLIGVKGSRCFGH